MKLAEKSLYAMGAALSLVVAVLGIQFVLTAPVTSWFMTSALFWIVAMLAALAFAKKHGLFAIIGSLFATMVVGRLFGTLRMGGGENTTNDPLLLAETGPGVPSVMWVSTLLAAVLALWIVNYIRTHRSDTPWGPVTDESWGLFFVRNYVGMMFIAHFSGHIFAGPTQFAIFESYFASIGLKPAAAMVALAGVSEVVAGIGLCLGFYTRLAALIGAVFLYLSMLWGNHFPVGYIWILPGGGWEFGIFWTVLVACFVLLGGGTISIDRVRSLSKHRSPKDA